MFDLSGIKFAREAFVLETKLEPWPAITRSCWSLVPERRVTPFGSTARLIVVKTDPHQNLRLSGILNNLLRDRLATKFKRTLGT